MSIMSRSSSPHAITPLSSALARVLWLCRTALGLPVVPEVYSTTLVSSGSTEAMGASASLASFIKVSKRSTSSGRSSSAPQQTTWRRSGNPDRSSRIMSTKSNPRILCGINRISVLASLRIKPSSLPRYIGTTGLMTRPQMEAAIASGTDSGILGSWKVRVAPGSTPSR